jgi:hypothetical protein
VAKVSAGGRQSLRGGFAVLSLALKFAFPGNRRLSLQSLGSRFLLTPRKAKHPVLLGPFGRQVSEANNAHAVRECAVDCSFDEIGCEESSGRRWLEELGCHSVRQHRRHHIRLGSLVPMDVTCSGRRQFVAGQSYNPPAQAANVAQRGFRHWAKQAPLTTLAWRRLLLPGPTTSDSQQPHRL